MWEAAARSRQIADAADRSRRRTEARDGGFRLRGCPATRAQRADRVRAVTAPRHSVAATALLRRAGGRHRWWGGLPELDALQARTAKLPGHDRYNRAWRERGLAATPTPRERHSRGS